LIYAFCVLIPIIVTDAIILLTVNQSAKERQRKELQYAMERIEYNLSEIVNGCILFTNNLYNDRQLDAFLNKKYESRVSYYSEYIHLLRNNSLSYNYNNGILNKIEVFTDNNTIINGGKISTVDTVRNTEWYQVYRDSGEDIFLYIYYDETKRFLAGNGTARTVSIIRKLDNYGAGGTEKFLKIDIDYNLMLRDVLNEKIDADIYVRNQDYILFSNLPNQNGMKDFMPASMFGNRRITMSKTFTTGKQEWEILIMAEDTPFWTVIFGNKGLIWLILWNVAVPSLLIYFVGKSISGRLSLVAASMDKVKQEQFEVISRPEGEDEIGDLIRSYNLMVLKIRNLIEVVFKGKEEKQALELSKKQAELKAVQSQVNPHFLFNTLETIRMRSLLKGENETADIIGELAILFRKSMDWRSDYITIEEEMSFVEKYINIQKYRFGDKIKYYHYIMEECREYQVPKLAIGTFIENAFIHGIETSEKDGVISLTITQNSEHLFIEISDNGRGFPKEKLDAVRQMLKDADSRMLYEAESTGMLNAFLRLKMFCEGNISFEIDSELENGTDIMIQIPLDYVDGGRSKEE
jgi:two-component system sensor histidine kinase YesM